MDKYLEKIKTEIIKISKNKKILVKILAVAVILFVAIVVKINDLNKSKVVIDTARKEEKVNVEFYVDISGEVNNPGVYEAEEGSRLYEIIEKAGGLTNDADTDSINQAKFIEDGEKIIIPSKTNAAINAENSNGLININSATKERLMELPGVGDAIADRIIEYRETTRFKSIEDIMCVNGIGNATFEKMKSKITV